MERTMTAAPTPPGQVSAPPRVVAISGMIFSTLFIASMVLVRIAVPADPDEPGEWLANSAVRDSVRYALHLVPFTGIAFLWFMGVLRNRVGLLEDRFFATVFLGSGLLFVATLFVAAAASEVMLYAFGSSTVAPRQSETYIVVRRMVYALINIFGVRMAAVFMFATSSIGLRTGFLARWLSYVGLAVGLVLLLAISDFAWIILLFPLWVLLVSTWVLIADFRQSRGTT
jgi:hypothetical protein